MEPSNSGKDTIIRTLVKENKFAFKEMIMSTQDLKELMKLKEQNIILRL